MKKSKVWKKELNQLRAISDVPWPARKFKTAPTWGKPTQTDRRCMNPVGERRLRRHGWRGVIDRATFRRPLRQLVLCGAPLYLEPANATRRRGVLICPRCSPINKLARELKKRARRGRRLHGR